MPPPGVEAYLERLTSISLRPFIRFQVRGRRCAGRQRGGLWRIMSADGEEVMARSVIGTTGWYRARPSDPDVEGLDRFAGTVFHWPGWRTTTTSASRSAWISASSAIQFRARIRPSGRYAPTVSKHTALGAAP